MKAFALTSTDQPASLVHLPDPVVADGGVVVRMRAASVNGFDVYQASGFLASMMPHDLPTIVGRDVAGVVEAVGAGRTDVAVGDEVLGFLPTTPPLKRGSFAEIVEGGPDMVLTTKPAGLSFELAAAIPLAGTTAHDAIHAVDIAEGDTVVVAGATGGVGSFAVQLAAHHGAVVVATARPGDEEAYVRSLGAHETVDYGTGDAVAALRSRFPDGIDVLIDLVSRDEAFAAIATLVKSGGRIASTLGAADVDALAARGIRATNVMGAPTTEKLADLAEHVDEGTLRVEVQESFPLPESAAAIAAFGAGKRGKIVIVAG
jgi:NADPH:quinone reductase-like Zn-dependent oxidoreductase